MLNIKFDEWRPMSDIPNAKGFKLTGLIARKGQWTTDLLTVEKGDDGCHYLSSQSASYVHTVLYSGWKPAEQKAQDATPLTLKVGAL